MKKLCITFGQDHVHKVGKHLLDKDCVAVISAHSIEEADRQAFEWFDGKFHQHVDKELWDEAKMKYFPRGYIYIYG